MVVWWQCRVWQTHDLWRLHVLLLMVRGGSVDGDLNESEAGSDIEVARWGDSQSGKPVRYKLCAQSAHSVVWWRPRCRESTGYAVMEMSVPVVLREVTSMKLIYHRPDQPRYGETPKQGNVSSGAIKGYKKPDWNWANTSAIPLSSQQWGNSQNSFSTFSQGVLFQTRYLFFDFGISLYRYMNISF